jgi:NAD-dependent deacetylase
MNFPADLLTILRKAKRITVLTGAGISAESGVPTFREAQSGLWAKFKPEELATPEAFRRNPKLVWDWYAWRREMVQTVEPNPGHHALAAMEARAPEFTLVTQNVDGLHQRAASKRVVELHGAITRTKCFEENIVVESWPETPSIPPRCPQCGGYLRPDVVWFGEALPDGVFDAAVEASAACDVFFSIGTSSVVYPAASLPYEAARGGATIIEINPQATELTPAAAFSLRAKAGESLPALVAAAWGEGH